MAEEQTEVRAADSPTEDALGAKPKKKASWVRTILWMLSMVMLVNLALFIVFWFMFLRK